MEVVAQKGDEPPKVIETGHPDPIAAHIAAWEFAKESGWQGQFLARPNHFAVWIEEQSVESAALKGK